MITLKKLKILKFGEFIQYMIIQYMIIHSFNIEFVHTKLI